jgi:hypothetical protein
MVPKMPKTDEESKEYMTIKMSIAATNQILKEL